MSIVNSTGGQKALKAYCQKLSAENAAKTNEMVVLRKQIDRLTQKVLSLALVNQNVDQKCFKCEEKDRRISELERNQRQFTQTRNKEKNEYQNVLKKLQQTKLSQHTLKSKYTVNGLVVNNSSSNKEQEQLRKKQNNFQLKIEELKKQKNQKISELQKNLAESKQQIQKQRSLYQEHLKLTGSQLKQKVDTNHYNKLTKTASEFDGIRSSQRNQTQEPIRNILERFDNKDHQVQKSQWTRIKIEDSQHQKRDPKSQNQKLKKENRNLSQKVSFIQKKLSQIEEWNRVLREDLLMKMPKNRYEIYSQPRKVQPQEPRRTSLFNSIQRTSLPKQAYTVPNLTVTIAPVEQFQKYKSSNSNSYQKSGSQTYHTGYGSISNGEEFHNQQSPQYHEQTESLYIKNKRERQNKKSGGLVSDFIGSIFGSNDKKKK